MLRPATFRCLYHSVWAGDTATKSWSAARRLLDAAGLQNCCCVLWALPSQGDGQSPNLFYMISSCLVHRTIGLMSMAAGEVVAIRGAAHTTEAQSAS